MNKITVPSFTLSQCAPFIEDQKQIVITDIFKENIISNIDSFDKSNNLGDVILICIREKMDDGDYRMSIVATQLDNCKNGVAATTHSYKKIKNIILNIDNGITNIIDRVLKISAFT